MYESWFRLSKRPFNAPPQTADYFADQGIETAREALLRCIERHAGPGVVIGDHGTGKSLLSLLVLRQCRFVRKVAHVSAPGIGSRKELMQTILFEFGLPYNLQDEGQLRLSLIDFLSSSEATRTGAVLIVDDAHELSTDLLEQLASLSDLVRDGQWCVNLVLFGQPSLEDQLTRPSLASLNQRIAARYYLRNWSRATAGDYIRFQLHHADASVADVFEPDALESIYEATGGVPRLINQVCDHAMILAAAGGKPKISAETIREAWSDLQSLPTELPAMPHGNALAGDDPIVEFGTLDDEQPSTDATELPAETAPPLTSGGEAPSEDSNWDSADHDAGSDFDQAADLNDVDFESHGGDPTFEFDFSSDAAAMPGVSDCREPVEQHATGDLDIEVGRFDDEVVSPGDADAYSELDAEFDNEDGNYTINNELERRLAEAEGAATHLEANPFEAGVDHLNDGGPGSPSEFSGDPWQSANTGLDSGFDADPDAVLDTIERQLWNAEHRTRDSSRPPRTDDASREALANPFMETFDEEELVISRSASLDVDLVARQPSVVTEQGGSLMDVLRLLETGWDDCENDEYGNPYALQGHVVGSPEISAAVAAAVAAHHDRDSSSHRETPSIESPPHIEASDRAVELPSDMSPTSQATMPPVELYGNVHVASGFSTGDRSTELPSDATEEQAADVIIAGFDGSLIAGHDPLEPFTSDRVPDVHESGAAVQESMMPTEALPSADRQDNATDPTSTPEASPAEPHKSRRFGSLFSGLRDR